jgi:hypothetical protein
LSVSNFARSGIYALEGVEEGLPSHAYRTQAA